MDNVALTTAGNPTDGLGYTMVYDTAPILALACPTPLIVALVCGAPPALATLNDPVFIDAVPLGGVDPAAYGYAALITTGPTTYDYGFGSNLGIQRLTSIDV